MLKFLKSLVPSATCGLLAFGASGVFAASSALPTDGADCEANGCDAFWDVYSPTNHTLSGGAHPTSGHGECECDGPSCIKIRDCAVSQVFTVDAGANYVCDGATPMGHVEPFTLTVTVCGKADKEDLTINAASDCTGAVLETFTLKIYCKKCEDHDGLGCP